MDFKLQKRQIFLWRWLVFVSTLRSTLDGLIRPSSLAETDIWGTDDFNKRRFRHIVQVDLALRMVSAKWISNVDQKPARVAASRLIRAWFGKDADFLSDVVTINLSWVHLHNQETK